MTKSLLPPLASLPLPLTLAALCLLAATGGPEWQTGLRFQREGIGAGELWRLITAHFVHLGWSHLWLNLAGLALAWVLVGVAYNWRGWLATLLVTALGTSAGLWFFSPALSWYVGLSGVLHGLLIAGALALIGKYKDAPLLLGLVAVKLAWEQWMGPMPGSEAAAGGPVVVSAHLYGAVSGAAAWLLLKRKG